MTDQVDGGWAVVAYKAATDRLALRRSLTREFREALEAEAIITAQQQGADPFAALSSVRYGLALAEGHLQQPQVPVNA